jgi:hypothetical protein
MSSGLKIKNPHMKVRNSFAYWLKSMKLRPTKSGLQLMNHLIYAIGEEARNSRKFHHRSDISPFVHGILRILSAFDAEVCLLFKGKPTVTLSKPESKYYESQLYGTIMSIRSKH